jgi:hypothetical protein
VRNAVCHYIYCISKSNLDLSTPDLLVLFSTIEENLKHPNIEISKEATSALREMSNSYYKDDNPEIKKRISALLKPSS